MMLSLLLIAMTIVSLFILYRLACYALQLQLQSLMETLSTTEPHYIRCVKPNNVLKPAIFENVNVIQQLRCGVSIHFVFLFIYIITFSIKKNKIKMSVFAPNYGHQKICLLLVVDPVSSIGVQCKSFRNCIAMLFLPYSDIQYMPGNC